MKRDPVRVEAPGLGNCPKCGRDVAHGPHGYTMRDRAVGGETRCGACGETSPNTEWPFAGGCTRCVRGIMLADTEDWKRPICFDCFVAVGENPDWHEVRP